MPTQTVRRLATKLAKMNNRQRSAVPGIGPKRSEIIMAGAQVYAQLLERLGLTGFRYSPMGLRDGILAQMLAEQDLRASVHRRSRGSAGQAWWRRAGATGSIRGRRSRCAQHAAQMFRRTGRRA